ncbi:MAG: hypothetical protein CME55_06465 [Halieaceae bacterium]|nr:hypothetical protein [Halieaceae bacterium]|tara:strand:- start:1717 stop:2205 length:489 start_codon:yes stop_codon:yes gene_type:complete
MWGECMNPEAYPSFNIIATGVDGTQIAILSSKDWADLVNVVAASGPVEWYMTPAAKALYNHTGKGYFPQGVTIGKTIVVHEKSKGNLDLLAHEYGHALGLQHTNNLSPDVMNPVNWMRVGDKHNLRQRFKQNFPDYTFMAAPHSGMIALAGVGLIGWMYGFS